MKRKVSKIVVVVMTGIIIGGCNTAYSEDYNIKSTRLTYDTGRVTKVDWANDFIYLDTNRKKGADVIIDGALGQDTSLKKGDFIFFGYDTNKKVDTMQKIK